MPRKSVLDTHLDWINKSSFEPSFDLDSLIKQWNPLPKANIVEKLYVYLTEKKVEFTDTNDTIMHPKDVYKDYIRDNNDLREIKMTNPRSYAKLKSLQMTKHEMCECIIDKFTGFPSFGGNKILSDGKDGVFMVVNDDDKCIVYASKNFSVFSSKYKCSCKKETTISDLEKPKKKTKKPIVSDSESESESESEEKPKKPIVSEEKPVKSKKPIVSEDNINESDLELEQFLEQQGSSIVKHEPQFIFSEDEDED